MKKIKVLNLYAGIGGNRKLWENVEVTAIEINKSIANQYQKNFPNDNVIITDAHRFLLKNFEDYDFIWSSPPCPTHSKIRFMATKVNAITHPSWNKKYPNMELYQEIIFLIHYAKCKWVVENVISYYEPLIKPFESGKHYFWSNFHITNYKIDSRMHFATIKEKEKKVGFTLENVKFNDARKDEVLRNCVEPRLGQHIFKCAFKEQQKILGDIFNDKQITNS